jgi:hypothetical protein
MKYIITENQLRKVIKKYFNKDLSNSIDQITDYHDLPERFRRIYSKHALNYFLNNYGPMYVFRTEDGHLYLVQDQGSEWFIEDDEGYSASEEKLIRSLGINALSPKLSKVIDAYFD